MKRLSVLVSMILLAASLVALPSEASATTITDVCGRTFTSPLNLAAAARVMVPNGRRAARPAGAVSANAMAAAALADAPQDPCAEPVSESVQSELDYATELAASGDVESARAVLQGVLDGLAWTPSTQRRAYRAGTPCTAFDSHHLLPPEQIRSALATAQTASALGQQDLADAAMGSAISTTSQWAASGADGQASSIPDWVGVLGRLQLIGADQTATDAAFAQLAHVAKDAYDEANRSACRGTDGTRACFFRAAQFLAAIGQEPASFAADVAYQDRAARSRAAGRQRECGLEKYVLRIIVDTIGGDGATSHLDTGLLHLTVKDRTVTSDDRGPLVVSDGTGSCWAMNESDQWQRLGVSTYTGGRFPYRITGTDDGESLHILMHQSAHITATDTGNSMCDTFGAVGVVFVNYFLASLGTTGLELPAGLPDVEQTDVSHGVFEPTGETTTDTSYVLFKQVYPRR